MTHRRPITLVAPVLVALPLILSATCGVEAQDATNVQLHLTLDGGPHAGSYELEHPDPCRAGDASPDAWALTVTFPDATTGPSMIDLDLRDESSHLDVWFGDDAYEARDPGSVVDDQGSTATLTVNGDTTPTTGGESFAIELIAECGRVARYGPVATSTPAPSGGNAVCALLTSAEIAQAFGEDVSPADGDHTDSCWWYVGPAGDEKTLTVYLWSGADPDYSFDVWQRRFQQIPDRVVPLEVAGHRAVLDRSDTVDSSRVPALFVETGDGGTLDVQASGYLADLDIQDIYVTLATLAVPRLAG
jgi:hypothetical protein